MAIVKSNQNQGNDSNTNILGPQDNTAQNNSYVSNGNPYGSYASGGEITTSSAPVPQTNTANAPQSSRKSDTGASSGSFTNVQTYIDKNKAGAQNLSQAASGTLTNTSDIAKNNLNKASQSFQNQAQAGSLQNKENALNEANTAFNEAANQKAATQIENKSNQAYLYQPKQVGSGVNSDSSGLLSSVLVGKDGSTYNSSNIQNQNPTLNSSLSKNDQDLINSNKSRVVFGDGTTRDFSTLAEANDAISSYNKANPGYYTYGNEQQLSSNDQRLSDILNAQYKGPTDLSEATGYNNAYSSVQDASALQNQALNTGDQSELLRRTFSTGQNEYTTGNQLLDNLLLGQGEANQAFREVAQRLGTSESGLLSDDLTMAQKQANQLAQQETADLRNIREQSRKGLSDTATQRQQEVESRIGNVLQNWEKYPQYFRDLFQNSINDYKTGSAGKAAYDKFGNEYNSAKSKLDEVSQKYSDIGKYSNVLNNVKNSQSLISQVEQLRQIINDPAQYANRDSNGSYRSSLASAQAKLAQLTANNALKTAQDTMSEADKIASEYGTDINSLVNANNTYAANKQIVDKYQSDYDKYSKFANYDPSSFNLGLSQLEAEALGIKGGEGLYNLLKDDIKGTSGTNTVDNLLKTVQADKNQLVSRNEQSQLARLQSLAQLANDYGSANSGINFRNQYTNADLAGKQNATLALDMENFKNLVQGAERGFRNDAEASNIVGQGYGTGSSRGVFGKKRASAHKTLSQNFGDLIESGSGYRNMYSDEGVDNELLKKIIDQTVGSETFGTNYDTSNLTSQLLTLSDDLTGGLVDDLGVWAWTNPVTAPLALANAAGSWLGGSKSKAQAIANSAAAQNALINLKANINKKVTDTGLRNQFSVGQNAENDLELLKLLGILDTTNL